MILKNGAHIHLIAACGTGMGSLAIMLQQRGFRITGSDSNVYAPMSTYLRDVGIKLIEGFSASNITKDIDLVVIGNAVSRGNPELEATLDSSIPYSSMPEMLRDYFISGLHSIVISGTHGKTTTTAIMAHLFYHAGLDPSFFIAGIPNNFDHSHRLGAGKHFIIEGDEYDSAYFAKWSKFFYYLPQTLVINNIEFDHADIFAELADIIRSFRYLVNTVPGSGLIVANSDDKSVKEVIKSSHTPVQTFGLESNAYWQGYEIKTTTTGTNFKVMREQKNYGDFWIPLHGVFNVRNAIAAIAVGNSAGIGENEIKNGLATFKGVKRRQEILGVWNNIVVIDDFAHHPTAVENTLVAIREAYPQHRLWALFEPASSTNSRAIFEDGYFRALSIASNIVVGQVPRPERARMDTPFVPNRLVEKLKAIGKYAWHFDHSDQICTHLSKNTQSGDVVLFLSNGGFSGIQQAFIKTLKSSHEND